MGKLEYDKDIYAAIVETGRLVPLLDGALVKSLSDAEASESERFKVGELKFESKYVFNTRDLDRICRVHAPLDANCWWDECKKNILTVKFYKIPVRGD